MDYLIILIINLTMYLSTITILLFTIIPIVILTIYYSTTMLYPNITIISYHYIIITIDIKLAFIYIHLTY